MTIRTSFRLNIAVALLPGLIAVSSLQALGQSAPQQPMGRVAPITANDVFAEIGRQAPGFGGIFVDEKQDKVYVYDVNGGPDFAAIVNKALIDTLGDGRPPERHLELLAGKYTFIQLKEWHDRVTMQILALPGTVQTSIDHRANRIAVGVEALDLAPNIMSVLDAMGVPREAVNIVQMPAATKEILWGGAGSRAAGAGGANPTLQDKWRPVVGGIQIQNNDESTCTLGVVAQRAGVNGIVTASHCTNIQGGTEFTLFFQPTFLLANFMGVEVADPCYSWWAGGGFRENGQPPPNCTPAPPPLFCPVGFACRLSDSSFAGFVLFSSFNLGFIAKPDVMNNSFCNLAGFPACDIDWNGTNLFRIVHEGTVEQGTTVNKVGRTTGWTQGMVTAVCANVNTAPEVIICANEADPGTPLNPNVGYWSQSGDSGAPVFVILNTPRPDDVEIVGIHFAAGGSFSPIGSATNGQVTGVQNIPHELGTLTKCKINGC